MGAALVEERANHVLDMVLVRPIARLFGIFAVQNACFGLVDPASERARKNFAVEQDIQIFSLGGVRVDELVLDMLHAVVLAI